MDRARPYRSTKMFDEETLPAALRARHMTKAGTWGVIRVLEGRVLLTIETPASDQILDPDHAGIVAPEQPHFVTPLGPMKMLVDFYDSDPSDL